MSSELQSNLQLLGVYQAYAWLPSAFQFQVEVLAVHGMAQNLADWYMSSFGAGILFTSRCLHLELGPSQIIVASASEARVQGRSAHT